MSMQAAIARGERASFRTMSRKRLGQVGKAACNPLATSAQAD